MELLYRLLSAAPTVMSMPRPMTVFVPGLPAGLPSFYRDLFDPLGRVETQPHSDFLRGQSYGDAKLCCVNGAGTLNRSAVASLIALIRRHHLGDAKLSPSVTRRARPPQWPAPTDKATFALVDRAASQPPAAASSTSSSGFRRSHASRAITNAAELLEACARSALAASCMRVRFPPEAPFRTALASLRDTSVLIGVHGAGLANAVFLPAGAAVVEILPRGFAAPGSFAITPDKYGWLHELGLRRVRLVARETRLFACASLTERLRKQWERLRDCDVSVEWTAVEAALLRPENDENAIPSRAADHTRAENATAWRCTAWPSDASVGSDEARCLRGNQLSDGYEYIHNAGRAKPGLDRCGPCACCRRRSVSRGRAR